MKKAFTLLEIMVAVLLGSIIMLIVAGTLRSTIKAWEAVQLRVSENYNRRTVLDLVKRQSASLFFRRDVDQIQSGRVTSNQVLGRQQGGQNRGGGGQTPTNPGATQRGFELPEGAYYFKGGPQEFNFLSTISFLSDFPGQVAVRYYVVQGEPDEDETLLDLPSSRTDPDFETDFEDDSGFVPESYEGGLYLYLEETNLFLNEITEQSGLEDFEDPAMTAFNQMDPTHVSMDGESDGEANQTRTMKLLGPLRVFNIRYRRPGLQHGASDADSEDNWSDTWDLEGENAYPVAIEFTFYFETPGQTEEAETEDLPGVRMVIPVYDTGNLQRGGFRGARRTF